MGSSTHCRWRLLLDLCDLKRSSDVSLSFVAWQKSDVTGHATLVKIIDGLCPAYILRPSLRLNILR